MLILIKFEGIYLHSNKFSVNEDSNASAFIFTLFVTIEPCPSFIKSIGAICSSPTFSLICNNNESYTHTVCNYTSVHTFTAD